MSLELFNSLATFGTFLVIAATAIAALVQLRHARSGNLVEAFGEAERTLDSAAYREALHFVVSGLPQKLQDSAFRYQMANASARTTENQTLIAKTNTVGNAYEQLGLLVKRGFLDREMALDMFAGQTAGNWERLAPVTVAMRRSQGNGIWENFEYFAVLSQDWLAAHPHGDYPAGVRRMQLQDEFREADEQYAAALAPA